MSSESELQRVRAAIGRLESYLVANKRIDVERAVAEIGISPSTLRNWIRSPQSILSAYRRREFAEAILALPDLEREKRNAAYDFALKELNVSPESQVTLEEYHGQYRVFHDFSHIIFNNILIKVERSPLVAIFAFKYSALDNRRGHCDGLVVSRRGRILCSGFSPTTVFKAVFQEVGYPRKDLIRGMAFIDDVLSEETRFSRIVLIRNSSSPKALETRPKRAEAEAKEAEDQATRFVQGSCNDLKQLR